MKCWPESAVSRLEITSARGSNGLSKLFMAMVNWQTGELANSWEAAQAGWCGVVGGLRVRVMVRSLYHLGATSTSHLLAYITPV